MSIVIYDIDDVIITVLTDKKDINAFLKGYLAFPDQHHYTVEQRTTEKEPDRPLSFESHRV